ncbi:MAG TPA: outer membrane protein transport protein [Thermoanaerobaculia bacterium]|jgi:long-subunit fatty acid transport protein|nr:outer membrane protein transport protein [Thermoanaerobaculia bacterium]
MRKFRLIALCLLAATPLAAQNTDIESLSGLQFNFGNPGARSLGMGGAFLGRADDASAAEANPAGLTILRKPEISVEARNYVEQQLFTTTGTYPDVVRTPFTHYSDRVSISFASAVYPIKNFTIGLYFHEPLKNAGGGIVFPKFDQNTGRIVTKTPNFYLPSGGGAPMSQAACVQLRIDTKNPAACLEYRVDPFISALDVRQRTWGFAAGWQVLPKLSVGANVRAQFFKEGAFTSRYDGVTFDLKNISVQATARANGTDVELTEERDITFGLGFKYAPTDKISVGGVYKQGARFDAPTFFLGSQTGGEFLKVADTVFHNPDIAGVGISYQPIPVLTINADADYVKYSNLVDDFVSVVADVSSLNQPFVAKNVTELHIGAEYFFAIKVPFAIRAGYWHDPAHAVTWNGPLTRADYIAEAMLYPKTQDQNHFSIGGGFAWPKFQIDFAYDTAKYYKVGSLSMVTRF